MADMTRADRGYGDNAQQPFNRPATKHQDASSTNTKRSPIHPEDVHLSRAWMITAAFGLLICIAIIVAFGMAGFLTLLVLGIAAAIYVMLIEPNWMQLQRRELAFDTLPAGLDGLRIGQIADTHLGEPYSVRNMRWSLEQMRREKPDLLVFTGDFIHKPEGVAMAAQLLREIDAPLGMYAVFGNHDYWEGMEELKRVLASRKITLLNNEHRLISHANGSFWIIGTDDVWDGTPDLDVAMQGVPQDAFKLLLAHAPYDAPHAAEHGVDLQLSGHTHGGHMVLPWLGPFAVPRYTDDYLSGLFRVGKLQVYVSRGNSGIPFRLLCRPEATIITLRRRA